MEGFVTETRTVRRVPVRLWVWSAFTLLGSALGVLSVVPSNRGPHLWLLAIFFWAQLAPASYAAATVRVTREITTIRLEAGR